MNPCANTPSRSPQTPSGIQFCFTSPVFHTGLEAIDYQHEMLIRSLVELQRTIETLSLEIATRRERFLALAGDHFEKERLLAEAHPGLQEFRARSEWDLIELARIQEECDGTNVQGLREMMDAFWQWTMEHMLERDTEYLPYVSGLVG